MYRAKTLSLEDWQFMELFAGQANLSQECKLQAYTGVSCDIDYGGKAMNLLEPSGPSGMAFFSGTHRLLIG